MSRVKTALTSAQKEILQRCSKDAKSYHELVALFDSRDDTASPPLSSIGAAFPELAETLPNLLNEAFYIYDALTDRVVYYNHAYATLIGGPEDREAPGATLWGMVHPDDIPRIRFLLNDLQHAPDGTVLPFTVRLRLNDEYQPVMCRSTVISRSSIGEAHHIVGFIEARPDPQHVAKTSHESQMRFLRLAESLPDTVFIFDVRTRRTLYENHTSFLGYTVDEITTREFMTEILWPDDRNRVHNYWAAIHSFVLTDTTPIFEIEYQLRGPQGGWEWVLQRASIISANAKGIPEQLLMTLSVITERKRIEQALITSERQYRELLNTLSLGVCVMDAETLKLRFWNPAFETILAENHASEPNFEGWQQAFSADAMQTARERMAALRDGATLPPLDYEITLSDGNRHIIHTHSTNITFEQRPAILTITQDITPQKQMEASLRESEQRYRILSEITTDFAAQFNVMPTGELETVWLSGRVEEISGYPAKGINAQAGWGILAHPDDAPMLQNHLRRLMEKPMNASLTYRIIAKNGEIRHIWGTAISLADPTGGRVSQIFAIGQDISERVRMQNMLIERERFIQQITDTMPVMIMVHNVQEQRNEWVNQYASDYVDAPNELNSARLMHPDDASFHPDDVALVADYAEMMRHAEDGRVYEIELRLRRYDGAYRWFNNRSVVFERAADGTVKSLISVMLDINDQKEAQAALLENQRLEVEVRKEHELNQLKSKMMQRISHEFRTPLAVILASSYVLQRVDAAITEERRRRHFNTIQAQIARVVTMLEDIQFIIYDEAQNHQRLLVNTYLGPLIDAVIEKAQSAHSDPRKVEVQLSPVAERIVRVDERLCKMILTNLVSNAFKFSGDATPVRIIADVEGDRLCVQVQDAGIGIPPDDIPHIFEPFYRANNFDEKPGLGLGLTIVKNAVELYGGSITVDHVADGGSAFTVYLPQNPERSASAMARDERLER